MPFNRFSSTASTEDIRRERQRDSMVIENLEQGKLQGRFRNERGAPSSATDIVSGDAVGDIVASGSYIYTLIDVFGTGLRWHRQSLAIGW